MTNEDTLAQLAAEVTQLRQQIEQANQRLDMIYGAVTRITKSARPDTNPAPKKAPSSSTNPFSASMMMNPGSMLQSLHQHAQDLGLAILSAVTK